MKKLILTMMLATIATAALAYDFIVDDIYFNIKNNNEVSVASGDNRYIGEVTIPTTITYEGTIYSVTSIENYAFRHCRELTKVTIGNSVTSIGNGAFYDCRELTSVNIPNSITTINDSTFFDCRKLTSITIPNSVTHIGADAFSWCIELANLTIGNSVTSIGNNAFTSCHDITRVNISDLEAWCNITFSNSSSNPCYLANHLFLNGEEIKDLVIPNSITEIKDYAFLFCSALTSVTIPNSVTSIGNCAFYICNSMTTLTIGNSVSDIGDYAFARCDNLTNISFSNSVTTIGNHAFESCKSLTRITIPNSVTEISSTAFNSCTNLTSIQVESGNPKYDSRDNCNAIIETFSNALILGCKSTIIPNSITAISANALSSCSGLTRIGIPKSVTNIGAYSFAYCNKLTEVYCFIVDPSLVTMGTSVFYLYNNNYVGRTLYVPFGSLSAYQADENWSTYFETIVEMERPTGDVNGDGLVTISDATNLIDMLLGSDELPAWADVNGDGNVTIADVTALIDMLLGN